MNLEKYKNWVAGYWDTSGKPLELRDDFIMCVGLADETGEVLELLKKAVRDKHDLSSSWY